MRFTLFDVGKIKNANIQLSDFTILIGKNSTNKSYTAHIVYMLNKILSELESPMSSKVRLLFNDFLKEIKEKIDINEYFNQFKQKVSAIDNKEEIYDMDDIFDFEGREVIYNFDESINDILQEIAFFLKKFLIEEINKSFNVNYNIVKNLSLEEIAVTKLKNLKINSEKEEDDNILALYRLFKFVISKYSKSKLAKESFYFPASRTGFVLAFDEIVSGVLRDRFGGRPTATKLTEPTIDFISKFADIKSGKFDIEIEHKYLFGPVERDESLKLVFDFISKNIIKGSILEKKEKQAYTQFLLQPKEAKEELEMHITSSSVVELLPLIIFLKHFDSLKNKLLVIEEPEAHFHPRAQIEIARLLSILVNLGAKVVITTHSDYILSEINNCLKLSNLDEKKRQKYLKKYNLLEEIVLKKDSVKCYLFKENNNSIEVDELNIDEYGISNENFDEVLDELIERNEYIDLHMDVK